MSRAAGVLLHVSSLPGSPGIGDLGPAATRFIRWLQEAGVGFWQILPLTPVTAGGSPYDSLSAFAGNTLLISPAVLVAEGLLPADWLESNPIGSPSEVDYQQVIDWKKRMVRDSWEHGRSRDSGPWREEMERWESLPGQEFWLEDWALFAALRERFGSSSWQEWDRPVRAREEEVIAELRNELADEIEMHCWGQWLFARQWHNVQSFAERAGVKIIGDVPIYVALDSADVWAHPELFRLDDDLNPVTVSGVPPDYFANEGQRWGNPIYDWEAHARTGYRWWTERLRQNIHMFDLIRLDHFRGFAGFWEIPASEPSAVNGRWTPGPSFDLFSALRNELGELPLIAEDLGILTPDVHNLRDNLGLPGMRVLQFGFGEENSMHLPHNYPEHSVAYTGTHDNDTFRGFYDSATPEQRAHAENYLKTSDPASMTGRAVEAVFRSESQLAIAPLQDFLGLGTEARLNEPGTVDGNWRWRAPANYDERVPPTGLRALLEQTSRAR